MLERKITQTMWWYYTNNIYRI